MPLPALLTKLNEIVRFTTYLCDWLYECCKNALLAPIMIWLMCYSFFKLFLLFIVTVVIAAFIYEITVYVKHLKIVIFPSSRNDVLCHS